MIIKRRLYSSSLTPEEQIERLKNMSPGMRGLSAGIMGIAGATPGILLRSGKLAAIGGALGASAGLYLTSKGFRERQIRKLEKEIEGKKKLSQSYVDRVKADRQKELQKIKEDYGSILPREFYILYKLSIELDEPSVGDGDEYCAVRCSDYYGIWKELEESDNEYIDYLVGSSSQRGWYTWNVKKKCWFDDRGKRVFNFKQRFIKDFQDNLKEVQGPGKPRSGYDTWEQWERDEVAKYLKNVIKELTKKIMIIQRKLFSKLRDSRIGVGWIQEGHGKTRSEKYFKLGKEAANKSYDEDEDEEKAIKKAKSRVTKEILKDELPVPVGKSIGYGGLAYIAAKSPEMINKLTSKHPEIIGDVRIPEKMSKFTKKHSGKIAAAVVGGSLLHQLSKKNLKKKLDSARTGIEVNTRDRVKKTNTSKKS